MKVWDLRNFRCLQTFVDREVYRQEDAIGGMVYDTRQRRLVTGNVKLKAWPLKQNGVLGAAGHSSPVSKVLYNRVFGDAVSGDQSGTVCVWNIETGQLRFRCGTVCWLV
jgi:WD40 repeat protein